MRPGKSVDGTGAPLATPRRGGPWRYVALALVLVLAGLVVAGVLLLSSNPTLSADSRALAKVEMPLGGGTITTATATGAGGRPIPLEVRGDQLWPRKLVPATELVSVQVVVKHPGWISWLSGSSDTLQIWTASGSAPRCSAPAGRSSARPSAWGAPACPRQPATTT